MRTPRTVFLPLATLGAVAALAAEAAAAAPSPPSASYPWVQPGWSSRGGATLPALTHPAAARWTQPPASIPIGPARQKAAAKTAVGLSGYRWVHPAWTARDGRMLPARPSTTAQPGAQPPAWIPIG